MLLRPPVKRNPECKPDEAKEAGNNKGRLPSVMNRQPRHRQRRHQAPRQPLFLRLHTPSPARSPGGTILPVSCRLQESSATDGHTQNDATAETEVRSGQKREGSMRSSRPSARPRSRLACRSSRAICRETSLQAQGIRESKGRLNVSVTGVGDVETVFEIRGKDAQDQAVHVVDGGARKPGRGSPSETSSSGQVLNILKQEAMRRVAEWFGWTCLDVTRSVCTKS